MGRPAKEIEMEWPLRRKTGKVWWKQSKESEERSNQRLKKLRA